MRGRITFHRSRSWLQKSRPYQYMRQFARHTGAADFLAYLWRTGLTLFALLSVLFIIERLGSQFISGFQLSAPLMVGALLLALLASGYVVYTNAIVEHHAALQQRDAHLRQMEEAHQRTITAERQTARSLQGEIETLTQELTAYRQRVPVISFGLSHATTSQPATSLDLTLPELPPVPDYDAILARHLDEVDEELRPDDQRRQSPFDNLIFVGRSPNPDFEQEASTYPERYRSFAQLAFQFYLAQECGRLVYLRPTALNQGSAPADDVVIQMRFPEGIRPATDDEEFWLYSNFEYEPVPPRLPQQMRSLLHTPTIDILDFAGAVVRPEQPIEGPILDDPEQPRCATYRVRRLVQGVTERGFEPLAVWLGDIFEDTSFEIAVQIYSSSFPSYEPVTSSITINCHIPE